MFIIIYIIFLICGVNAAYGDDRMNNVSTVRNYPWNVGIYRIITNNFQLECAGSIISLLLVLAGPKCVDEMNIHQYTVIAGSAQKYVESTINQNIQKSAIYKKISNNYFDILVLKKQFELTLFVLPVCLRPIETVFTENEIIELEIPYWTREDDNLKTIQIEVDQHLVHEFPMHLNITTNLTDYVAGGVTIHFKRNRGIRYCIVGFVTDNEMENMFLLMEPDLIFVQQVMERYDIRSSEISECIVPATSKHIRTIGYVYNTGDFVLNGTKIKYTCEEYYNLYGSDEITCQNSTWIYSSGQPYCLGCGISNLTTNRFNSSKFIYKTNPKYFPWHAELYNKEKSSSEFICGGSIISSKIILSNEFCVDEENSTKFTNNAKYFVKVGQYNWNTSLDTYLQQVDVGEIIFYGVYLKVLVGGIYSNVIALILNERLQLNEHVLPVCLDLKGVMKSFTPPLVGVMPFGPLERNGNGSTFVNFLYISEPLKTFWDNLLYYTHEDLYCPNDTHWSTVRGNALTFKMPISKNENRYFLHSIFHYGYCERNRIVFLDMFRFVKWLKSIADLYNY